MRHILWFRRDLRTEDNPLLACEGEVLPIFIFDPSILQKLPQDDRRVSFIYEQVRALKSSLQQMGLDLAVFYGKPQDVFRHLLSVMPFDGVRASGDYDAYALERDRDVSHLLPFEYLQDTYIFAPEEVMKDDGTPYMVFTPFYKRAQKSFTPGHLAESQAQQLKLVDYEGYAGIHKIDGACSEQLDLTIASIGFSAVEHHVAPLDTLLKHFASHLEHYADERDFFDEQRTSGLSVHLRFGTLGIRQLLRWLVERKKEGIDTEPFFRQLVFRDFYAYLLYHFPQLSTRNFKYPFKGRDDHELYAAFCEGRTGVPVVDAGIKELLATGNMHNRVRMIAASFFTKDLLLPWQWGESFFAQHLNDYDAASNVLSWQWSAGTGVDPQPYFRIFNPYRQSERFDKEGVYIKRWIPQLAKLTSKTLHDESYFLNHDIPDYPRPVVVHKDAVEAAKAYFAKSLGHTA